ncbi:MAG: Asp-tRNA(Asn)/Glu-tRNA(Gln) amidotransferase subunit GatB [Patescibacteria group bacterium]
MYTPTVGLEIHAELKTRTKMFCACLNDADEKTPNKNICPVCMAHPGALPVINEAAVKKVLLVGTALGATLARDYSEFDRKNYFYPDIPKGYQISQYLYPLVVGGSLSGVAITRVHLEEDTARSQHQGETSLVDFNRAGVPLMELVTDPVIHDAQTAGNFARELQLLLRSLGVGDANMEKGEMRVEANISVSKDNTLGTKVEVKNLNSFRSVERAIAFEIERQTVLLEKGERVAQETRGWDEQGQKTYQQRKKESSHDYRYFPDPDLPKLHLSEVPEFSSDALCKELPELPAQRRERYTAEGMPKEYIEMFIADQRLGGLFEATAVLIPSATRLVANYIGSDLAGLVQKMGDSGLHNITPQGLAAVIVSVQKNEVSSRGAKDALAEAFAQGGDLSEIIKKYTQQSDIGALETIARKVVGEHPQVAADFKAGKEAALQFLVGQGMKESQGKADPRALRETIQKILS